MKKLSLILLLAFSVSVFADTPIKDLRVTASETIKSGATVTLEAGAKVVPRPTIVISALDIDWRVGSVFSKILAANSTFTFSNVADGNVIVVALTNTASNFTATFPAGIKWAGGAAPVLTLGAKTDVFTFCRIGSTTYGSVVQNMF